MLWKPRNLIQNYKNSGYDVLSISPTFQSQVGWANLNKTIPYWGTGTGQLTVDYRDTSEDFWAIALEKLPIAIMSFSRGSNQKIWELEAAARNRAQADWVVSLSYYDDDLNQHTVSWDPPYAGGGADDFSPYKGQGAITGNPPDPTQDADDQRASNLPMVDIRNAINAHFNPNVLVAEIDQTGNVGSFVSEYMAYHVAWFRDYINAQFPNDPSKQCLFAGHTHVGIPVSSAVAEEAGEIQLDELIEDLP
ncbi:MAG: hypothetical protein KJZ69_18875 [Phycisphaerales bacterium]|nr:hypothetical protein [Phycisphaerales bacterium]